MVQVYTVSLRFLCMEVIGGRALYPLVDLSPDEVLVECTVGRQSLVGRGGYQGPGLERLCSCPSSSLLSLPPGGHGVSTCPPPGPSAVLLLPWS